MTTGAEPISLREAAARLGVHYMTAYRHVRTGRLPARRGGAHWLIDPSDLDRLRSRDRGRAGSGRRHTSRAAAISARMAAGDEAGAWRVIEEALSSGMEPAGIYSGLLVPVLRNLGDGWAAGTVSVAEEHRASAVTLRLVGRLGPMFARRGPKRGTVIVGAPAGDQHSLPSALIADLLRGEGFEVFDTGANTPAGSFAETARHAARLIATVIGVTAPGRDSAVRSAVRALHRCGVAAPVLVGGSAVTGPAHAARLGADGWSGPDGRSVIAAVDRAAAGGRRSPGAGSGRGEGPLADSG